MTAATVTTVLGDIASDQLGFTLPHEHLLCNTLREYRSSGLLADEGLAVEELRRFADLGGGSLVDLTTDEIGRNPVALARISRATGVHIVMGSGHYRDPYLDREWFDRHDVGHIADLIVRDATSGVRDTGIRSGIIGEIGADKAHVSAVEERSLRAAARAHHRTGLTISTHAARFPVGLLQLDLLEHEGVSPDRIIVGHVDTVPDPAYPLQLAARGCWVQLDGFGTDSPHERRRAMGYLTALSQAGHLARVLISQDVFLSTHLRANGGAGYAFIAETLLQQLAGEGFTPEEIDQLSRRNPQQALAGDG